MTARIGIRREDKNAWERRVPLVPADVKTLIERDGLAFSVQPSPVRAFADSEYVDAGAEVCEDLSGCDAVIGVKEMPVATFHSGGTYMFFAHVIKGQAYNMPMLRDLMAKGCNLLDYEKIVDDKGRRLVFFGRHAGLAGMIDGLWALGARLAHEGFDTPLAAIRPAHEYADLAAAKQAIRQAGEAIHAKGLPPGITPLVTGFAGYGNVSQGAQEIYDLLPVQNVAPDAIPARGEGSDRLVYKVVFKEEHMVRPVEDGAAFDLQDYYGHPEKYRGVFEPYLARMTMLVNAVYWDERYPRLATKKALRQLWSGPENPALRVISDISCDVGGSCEATVKATESDNPVYVWDVDRDAAIDGVAGKGPVIQAVDNLPAEIPRESSADFSRVLRDFIAPLAMADFKADAPALPGPLASALIVHRGVLTPDFAYIEKYLGGAR